MQVPVTAIYRKNLQSQATTVVNIGGGGSSKSHSLQQLFIYYLTEQKSYKLLVTRKTFPSLRQSAYRLIVELLEEYGIYSHCIHNKSEHTIKLGNSLMQFSSIDDPEKIKSTEWDFIFMEEASDFTWQDYFQLSLRLNRTKGAKPKIYLAFNPIDEYGWFNEELKEESDIEWIHSTYRDNPFLSKTFIDRLRSIKDPELRKIYAEGLYGHITGLIFTDTTIVEKMPDEYQLLGYWLDFGFSNDPTSFGILGLQNGELWADELIYETGLTNVPPLINDNPDMLDINNIHYHLRRNGVPQDAKIIADSAEPKSIEELYGAGWNVHPAPKGPDSIKAGIDIVKRYPMNITKRSIGLIRESKMYKWAQDKDGKELNKPVDRDNHSWDGIRYVCLSEIGEPAGRIIDVSTV